VRKFFIYVSLKNFEMAGVSRTATNRRPYLDDLFVFLLKLAKRRRGLGNGERERLITGMLTPCWAADVLMSVVGHGVASPWVN
jgi:hypothetical protein